MTVIGLTGFAQVGKDTVADILVQGHGFRRIAFADKLREACLALDPWVNTDQPRRERETWWPHVFGSAITRLSRLVEQVGWDRAKVEFPEVRRLLQHMGTEVGRSLIGDDVWVDIALQDVRPSDDVVITDVRFDNERQAVKGLGGLVVEVTRSGHGPLNGHASDVSIPGDRVLANDGDLDHLRSLIDGLVDNTRSVSPFQRLIGLA